ncbi:Galactose-1-phosphate uridylyltransferase [Candidatus Zixiibacteriota bacterium]|nr:Galactose-1-phosphate uridylyltransferase [candidate division Zixibacteria bacterium]
MPEFRQNMATKEWVILAPERGKRPHEFVKTLFHRETPPPYKKECPFCKGNEHLTVEPTLIIPTAKDWKVRVVPNKFAALRSDLDIKRKCVGAFLAAEGFGIAEVVVEHPRHDLTMALMTPVEVADILSAYKIRQREISRNSKVNLVTIFRNHGPQAGTSLEHPHSQIIATPIVPPHVRYPMEQAMLYYDAYGRCVYCDMAQEEIRQKERIIVESENFLAFCPYAARSPFECRIYPKNHLPSFVVTNDAQITELGKVLREVLARIHFGLNDPDYNYIIRSAAVGDEDTRHQHWYIVIVPKISIPAGFEIGSGIYINSVSPEDCAAFLRGVQIP